MSYDAINNLRNMYSFPTIRPNIEVYFSDNWFQLENRTFLKKYIKHFFNRKGLIFIEFGHG